MATYSGEWDDGKMWSVTDDLVCTVDRTYVNNPIVNISASYNTYWNVTEYVTFNRFDTTLTEYDAWHVQRNVNIIRLSMNNIPWYINAERGGVLVGENRQQASGCPNYASVYGDYTSLMSTNIPVFTEENTAYYEIYCNPNKTLEERNEALTHAFNYRGVQPEVVGDKFTSAKLNLLRRRLLDKVRNSAST